MKPEGGFTVGQEHEQGRYCAYYVCLLLFDLTVEDKQDDCIQRADSPQLRYFPPPGLSNALKERRLPRTALDHLDAADKLPFQLCPLVSVAHRCLQKRPRLAHQHHIQWEHDEEQGHRHPAGSTQLLVQEEQGHCGNRRQVMGQAGLAGSRSHAPGSMHQVPSWVVTLHLMCFQDHANSPPMRRGADHTPNTFMHKEDRDSASEDTRLKMRPELKAPRAPGVRRSTLAWT